MEQEGAIMRCDTMRCDATDMPAMRLTAMLPAENMWWMIMPLLSRQDKKKSQVKSMTPKAWETKTRR